MVFDTRHQTQPGIRHPARLIRQDRGPAVIILLAAVLLLWSPAETRADCPAAPLTSPDDLVISFRTGEGGPQAAPGALLTSTVKDGMLVYDGAAKALKLCNGTSWITLQSTSGAGAAAGSVAGAVQFRGAGGNLAADDANFVWDDTNNRLGIGTGSPQGPLHVKAATDENFLVRSIAGELELAAVNDANTAYVPLRFDASGYYLMDGNVGIGTTAPLTKLDVTLSSSSSFPTHPNPTNTVARFSNADGLFSIVRNQGYGAPPEFTLERAGGTAAAPTLPVLSDNLGTLGWRGFDGAGAFSAPRAGIQARSAENWSTTAQGTYMAFYTTPNASTAITERLRIDHNGNLGIGTTSPDMPLSIAGTTGSLSSITAYSDTPSTAAFLSLRHARGSVSSPIPVQLGDRIGAIAFAGYKSTNGFQNGASIEGYASENYGDTAIGTDLTFNTAPNGSTARVERMRITNTGNVGIGTTDPGGMLHALGSSAVFFDRAGTTASHVVIRSAKGTVPSPSGILSGDMLGRLSFQGYSTQWESNSPTGLSGVATENWTTTAHGSAIAFSTTSNGSLSTTERMRIDHNGNVGIGTSSPGSSLDVKGTLRLSGATSGYVGLTPPAAAGSTTYTLPSTDGSNGQVLSTNGSGILSWTTGGASSTSYFWAASSHVTYATANASCPSGSRVIFVPQSRFGQTGTQICLGDVASDGPRRVCDSVRYFFIRPQGDSGTYSASNLACSASISVAWPWAYQGNSPNSRPDEWQSFTYAVCCRL